MNTEEYIKEKNIFFLKEESKSKVLNTLIYKAFEYGYLTNANDFRLAVDEREARLSTGIGGGVAIPHARLDNVKEFFVMFALIEQPVSWASIDQKPVNLVFLIGGPENAHSEYIQILSKIMNVVKNEDKKAEILKSNNSVEIANIFK